MSRRTIYVPYFRVPLEARQKITSGPKAPKAQKPKQKEVKRITTLPMTNSFAFSQQLPEASQQIPDVKPRERDILQSLDPATQDRMVTDLSRTLLFKALNNEPIDRSKLAKEAWGDRFASERGAFNAALKEASDRMQSVWGFSVRKIPKYMEDMKTLPKKYRDRLYVVNQMKESEEGNHSRALHGYHTDASIEKSVLMLVLAFIYCRGDLKDGMRWIGAGVLYKLLHSADDQIPQDPPSSSKKRTREFSDSGNGTDGTPNVDILLERFVQMDYLLKTKADKTISVADQDENDILYAMGPRAAMEIGQRQIIYFCAEVLDEEPDPIMLAELGPQEDEENDEPL